MAGRPEHNTGDAKIKGGCRVDPRLPVNTPVSPKTLSEEGVWARLPYALIGTERAKISFGSGAGVRRGRLSVVTRPEVVGPWGEHNAGVKTQA